MFSPSAYIYMNIFYGVILLGLEDISNQNKKS